jgi:uncharacterized protein (TIGR02391 family)
MASIENGLRKRLDPRADLSAIARAIPTAIGWGQLGADLEARITPIALSVVVGGDATTALDDFFTAFQICRERYLAADDEEGARLCSGDLGELGFDELRIRRTHVLLKGEMLLTGGQKTYETDNGEQYGWDLVVYHNINLYREVRTLDEYLEERRAQISEMSGSPGFVPDGTPITPIGIPRVPQFAVAVNEAEPSTAPVSATEPGFDLNGLHPLIREAVASRFESGHLSDGVLAASIAFCDLVRKRTGLSGIDGHELVSQAFSPDRPRLAVADTRHPTGKSIQLGVMQLAQGSQAAIRNLVAHEKTKLEFHEAFEMVSVFSLLARRVEKASLRRVAAKPSKPAGPITVQTSPPTSRPRELVSVLTITAARRAIDENDPARGNRFGWKVENEGNDAITGLVAGTVDWVWRAGAEDLWENAGIPSQTHEWEYPLATNKLSPGGTAFLGIVLADHTAADAVMTFPGWGKSGSARLRPGEWKVRVLIDADGFRQHHFTPTFRWREGCPASLVFDTAPE